MGEARASLVYFRLSSRYISVSIAVHIPVFQRLELTRACYVGLQRARLEFLELGYVTDVYIGASEDEHEELARDFGFHVTRLDNRIMGVKNQKLLEFMLRDSWDYLLQLGSDDFLLPGGAAAIVESMKRTDYAQFQELYFFNRDTRKGWKLIGYPCGAGRYISRSIVDATPRLWGERHKGLDSMSAESIYGATGRRADTIPGAYIADVKTDVNITPYFRDKEENLLLDDYVPEAALI